MRHYKKGRKLGSDASHTKAIKKSLVVALFQNDRIKTTLERAKEIRGDVDRVITWAKRGDVHARRLAIAAMGDKALVAEIFTKVEQGLFKDRPGGYTRIFRLGTRRGDGASIVIMELVQEPVVKKGAADTAEKKPLVGRRAKKDVKVADKVDAADEVVAEEAVTDEAVIEAVEDIDVEETVAEVVEAADEAAVEIAEETQAEEASAEDTNK